MIDKIGGHVINASVGVVDSVVMPQGNHRHVLIFSNNSANTIQINFGQPATNSMGVKLTTTVPVFYVTRDDIGGLIDTDIHALAGGAGSPLGIIVGYYK